MANNRRNYVQENLILSAGNKAVGKTTNPHVKDPVTPKPRDGHSHIWVEVYPAVPNKRREDIWVCTECNELRWMPSDWYVAVEMSQMIGRGKSWRAIYNKFLHKYYPEIEEIIQLMEGSLNGSDKRRTSE